MWALKYIAFKSHNVPLTDQVCGKRPLKFKCLEKVLFKEFFEFSLSSAIVIIAFTSKPLVNTNISTVTFSFD